MLYASSTGNTELIAEAIVDYLEQTGHQVQTKSFDFDPIDVGELLEYDAVLIGTYTWDEGELPYEVEDFYEELEDVDLSGKPVGVFGSCDSFYPDTFGGAIELMGDRLVDLGAKLVPERLKIDLEPSNDDVERSHAFAQTLLNMTKDTVNI